MTGGRTFFTAIAGATGASQILTGQNQLSNTALQRLHNTKTDYQTLANNIRSYFEAKGITHKLDINLSEAMKPQTIIIRRNHRPHWLITTIITLTLARMLYEIYTSIMDMGLELSFTERVWAYYVSVFLAAALMIIYFYLTTEKFTFSGNTLESCVIAHCKYFSKKGVDSYDFDGNWHGYRSVDSNIPLTIVLNTFKYRDAD